MPNEPPVGEVTVLLRAVQAGRAGAANRLLTLVYAELHKIAVNRAIGRRREAIEPTVLIHEAYLRMFGRENLAWQDRHHFFWAASRAMEDILIENARRRLAAKRRANGQMPPIADGGLFDADSECLRINEAIRKLESIHPESAYIVRLKFYGGLTQELIASITGQSYSTVGRNWKFAKSWLKNELDTNVRCKQDGSTTDWHSLATQTKQ